MAEVVGLVTTVDEDWRVHDARRISVSTRQHAVLDEGAHVVLIDDRGWCQTGPLTLWADLTAHVISDTARLVIGPFTLMDGHVDYCLEREHWAHLVKILHYNGVTVDPFVLALLPHHVVLSHRLQAQLQTPAGRPRTT